MKKLDIIVKSLINASGIFVYILIVAGLLLNAGTIFSEPPGLLIPIFMLLLFIISASVTGFLVLGKPIHLYLGGFKKEAVILLFATLAWLVFFLAAVAIVILLQ